MSPDPSAKHEYSAILIAIYKVCSLVFVQQACVIDAISLLQRECSLFPAVCVLLPVAIVCFLLSACCCRTLHREGTTQRSARGSFRGNTTTPSLRSSHQHQV